MNIPIFTVYFSFDDGPNDHDNTTERLLDVLDKYQIRALFFLLGENIEQYPHLVKRIYDKGHYVANHGYSDKHAYKMSDDEFKENLLRTDAAIIKALEQSSHTKELPRLYRPHGGFINSSQEKICIEEGFSIIPVTVRVYDAVASASNKKRIIKRTVSLVKKNGGGMILLHDARDSHSRQTKELERNPNGAFNRSWIPDAVEEIITALLEAGFNLNGKNLQ